MKGRRRNVARKRIPNTRKAIKLLREFLETHHASIDEAVKSSRTLTDEEKAVFGQFNKNLAFHRNQPIFSEEEGAKLREDLARAEKPYGITMPAFSPQIRIILLGYKVYTLPDDIDKSDFFDDSDDEEWEDYRAEVLKNTPQTFIFHSEEIRTVFDNLPELAADYLFIASMSNASIEGRYPHEEADVSPEFKQCLKEAFQLVAHYLKGLSEEELQSLPDYLREVGDTPEEELDQLVEDFVLYQSETSTYFLDDSWSYRNDRHVKPKEAVATGESFLHCDKRNLPIRARRDRNPIPKFPWVEYCRNYWSFKHQIFGRYECKVEDRLLRVDYLLDSTHMPGRYGFYSAAEITEESASSKEHVILGLEFYRKHEEFLSLLALGALAKDDGTPFANDERIEAMKGKIIPIISAGSFDFVEPTSRRLLQQLADDPATKPDIAIMLADTLEFAADRSLLTAEQWDRVAKKEQQEMKLDAQKN